MMDARYFLVVLVDEESVDASLETRLELCHSGYRYPDPT